MINLVFDKNIIPIQSTTDHDNIFIYQDHLGNKLKPSDIFVSQNYNDNNNSTVGSIMTENVRLQYIDQHTTDDCLNYILSHNTQHPINSHEQTSPTINSSNINGIYELQINTQIQNDSGANRSVTNLISLLHNFKKNRTIPNWRSQR